MEKFKVKMHALLHSKGMRLYLMGCTLATALCASAFAVGETPPAVDMAGAFTTGFQKIVTDSIGMISAMLPIAITLCGALFLVKKGMSWFKSVAK